MAIIYENQQDVEREKLELQLREKQRLQYYLLDFGLLTNILGLAFISIDELKNFKAKTLNQTREFLNTESILGGVSLILGSVGIISSIFVRQSSKKLEKLPPLEVIKPTCIDKAEPNFYENSHVARLEKNRETQTFNRHM